MLVTSDVGFDYYLEMLRVNKCLNLFVNFEEGRKRGKETVVWEEEKEGFGSGGCRKRVCSSYEAEMYQSCKNSEDVGGEDVVGEISTAGSKTPIIMSTQVDDEVLAEVEEIEARLNGGKEHEPGPVVSEVKMGTSEETEDGIADEDTKDREEIVAPRGYDKEFWGNFLDNDYGGSNVVEVMCTTNTY